MNPLHYARLAQRQVGSKRDPLLTEEADRNLTRIGLGWFLSAYLVALIAYTNELSFSTCGYCMRVAEWVPSILVMAQGSHAPEAMRFVMLYHTLTAPAWLVLMWIYASDFRRLSLQWLGYPFLIGIFTLASYTSIYGLPFGGDDAKGFFGRSYYESLFISTMVSSAFWGGFLTMTYLFWFYLVVVRFYRWLKSKMD